MKVSELQRKLGVSSRKKVADLLGVNKLTLQRWGNNNKDHISKRYIERAEELLKMSPSAIEAELAKAAKRKPDQRFNTVKIRLKRRVVVRPKNETPKAPTITITDLIYNLHNELQITPTTNGLNEVKEALTKYIKEKIKVA